MQNGFRNMQISKLIGNWLLQICILFIDYGLVERTKRKNIYGDHVNFLLRRPEHRTCSKFRFSQNLPKISLDKKIRSKILQNSKVRVTVIKVDII